jgi:hypothetical protein
MLHGGMDQRRARVAGRSLDDHGRPCGPGHARENALRKSGIGRRDACKQ